MITRPDRQADLRAPRPTRPPEAGALAARLTDRDRWILRMLHEHRVLTTTQLTDLAFPTVGIARRRLAALHRAGVLDRFRPLRVQGSAPAHWVLAPAGAAVLAAEAGVEVRELGYRHHRTLAVAHSLHLAHTIGIAEFFTTLTTTARHHPDAAVLEWWSENRCRRLWGDLARPDAFGRYTRTGTRLDFFLEFDLGSTSLPRVAAKLLGYAELARSTGVTTPVLFWVPTGRRERTARQVVRETWARLPDPATVPVATAAADLLNPGSAHPSPADRVWLPLDTTGPVRVHLHELSTAWPTRTPAPGTAEAEHASPATIAGFVDLPAPPPTRLILPDLR
ncbi:replication-relaxation family protein [Nocardia miyunensis]|uniref:replication-relaxation family protein n=1 Tax=Nocardia miyunensis TaxID=282684 RepID=UPI0008357811|nr:replication-relaxation family protein [Nocardia miyunensis]